MKKLVLWGLVVVVMAVVPPDVRADFSQDFQIDTSGWFPNSGTANQEADGYLSPVPYANGVTSASPTEHARLRRGDCDTEIAGGGPTVFCEGAFTRWGGYNAVWSGGYTTQVDVYLDVPYAIANPDSYGGNIACLTANGSDNSCPGTRFDFTSAINDSSGNFLQDFVFNVGTGDPGQPTPCGAGGFVVAASTNAFRSGASPYNLANDPFCVDTSGWYTFKHTFMDVSGSLVVLMEIFPLGSNIPLNQWTILSGQAISNVGCNRYGWFADEEIQDLPIDNSIMIGCGAPLTTTTVTTTTVTTTTTSTTPPSSCGNSFVEAGEQCDPPSSPCVTSPGGAFGICDGACQCVAVTTTTNPSTTTTSSVTTTSSSTSSSSVTSTVTTTSSTATTLPSSCGNAILESGEQCDPPTSPCVTSPGGAFGTCDGSCQCIENTTTSSTIVITTTSTSSTVATTSSTSSSTSTSESSTTSTSVTTTTSSSTTTTICSPENTSATCGDTIDNDCDGLPDCADPDCAGIFPCPPARKDPTSIVFGRNGKLDRLKGHAKLTMAATDVAALPVAIVLNDLNGVIYRDGLSAGALSASPKGAIYKFRNAAARSAGGMYDLKIKKNNDGSYTFGFTSYGDLARATDSHMRLQFYVGTDANAAQDGRVFITIDTPWTKTPRGWRAPKDH